MSTVMTIAHYGLVFVHVLAALFWLGGMFFLGLVGAPVLRTVEPAALRQRLFHELGMRFRSVGWAAIATLVITGVLLLRARGLLHWSGVLGAPAFWRTTLGVMLAAKLVAVAMMVTLSLIHDFILGPAAGRAAPESARAITLRRNASLLARANALIGLVLVAAAVRLGRG